MSRRTMARLGAWGLGLGARLRTTVPRLTPHASRLKPFIGAASVLVSATLLSACRQDMHDAPRYDPLESSTVFPKGSSAQPLIAGTVPRGMLREDKALYEGKNGAAPVDTFPFAITRADLDRGQERFNIYCSP